ncbi:hemerythrin domain-containing protein [Streptomyces sp. NPDC050355]|uniref:hemerythrin domain-containing protein n=1 Tax=Streptomyces sp. NPDC050355 TaxID=3365609 RepID=UPI003793A87A
MEHGADVIEELTGDHRVMDGLFEQLDVLEAGCIERKLLLDALTIELVRHSVAEEMHLYPAVREHLENGDVPADNEIADHDHVEEMLKDLEGRGADDRDFDRLVRELRTEVTAHFQDEEGDLFPRVRDGVHPYVLESLGKKVREAKKTAPTRPHPHAPSAPPANKLLAPGLGLVDRIRDYVTGGGQYPYPTAKERK